MKKLVIIGAGGFGREIAWLVDRINKVKPTWNLLGFIDDNPKMENEILNGVKVIGSSLWLNNQAEEIYAVCSIGSARIREEVIKKTKALKNIKFANLIDPSVIMSDFIKMGEGNIICAGSILTTNITLENHVIINLDCTIGHDAVIKSYTTLYPSVNVSGSTVLEKCVEMGTGSQIIQGKKIEEYTIVGAGAVVVKNLPSMCTAVGIPAKPL